jgi:hypothetical protein
MTKLQTRREYLADLGLAKPGARGKFSNAAKEALAKADAEGFEFLDGPSPKGNGSGPIKSTVKKAKPTPVESTGIVDLTPYRYEENTHKAIEVETGIERSLRSACNSCRVSLVVCWCDSPIIVARDGSGSIHVRVESR